MNLDHDFARPFVARERQMRSLSIVMVITERLNFIQALRQGKQIHVHEVEQGIAVVFATSDFDNGRCKLQ